MSTLKQQLLIACLDAVAWSFLSGMLGGTALADGNNFSAVVLILLSVVNARNAVVRWQLFRSQS